MKTLKWLLNTSLLIAFMFLGMEAKPQEDERTDKKLPKSVITLLIG